MKTIALIFDTETTGFASFNDSWFSTNHARMIQFAGIQVIKEQHADGRVSLTPINSYSTLIKPEGFSIPEQASKVHGIDIDKALRYGNSRDLVLHTITDMMLNSDELIAFNIAFDMRIFCGEFLREFGDSWYKEKLDTGLKNKQITCAMRPLTNICKLPRAGSSAYKFPKLEEAYRHFFQEDFEGAHDALADVQATIRVHEHYLNLNKEQKDND